MVFNVRAGELGCKAYRSIVEDCIAPASVYGWEDTQHKT